jgi:hypothetical protein
MAKKSPVPPSNHLMINLCVANLLESLLCFVVYTIPTAVNSWFLGSMMCKVLPHLLEGCRVFSFAILTVLARYRYHAISKPLKQVKHRKVYIYLELFVFACWAFGTEIGNGVKRSEQFYAQGRTRCFDHLHLKNTKPILIVVSYFLYVLIVGLEQMYYFTKTARILWKNSKQRGDNKLGSSQRVKRNKKAVKTIFIMVLVYDLLVLPTAIFKSIALYDSDLTAFREYSNILLLIYCSFNSTFYIWRDERLKKTVMRFFARLFCGR